MTVRRLASWTLFHGCRLLPDLQRAFETNVARRRADVDGVLARSNGPVVGGHIPVGEPITRDRHRDILGLARLQIELRPSHETLGRFARQGRQPKVDLRHFRASDGAGIGPVSLPGTRSEPIASRSASVKSWPMSPRSGALGAA